MTDRFDELKVYGLARINVLLGKNGCGKSTRLKEIDAHLQADPNWITRYVTPERAGILKFDPSQESMLATNPENILNQRRRNQYAGFKQQTTARYRQLETDFLRRLDKDMELRRRENWNLDSQVIKPINALLDNIVLEPTGQPFAFVSKSERTKIAPEEISSGESELVTLVIECLSFANEEAGDKKKLLLLDEPDVHLHPDLQVRFASFLYSLATEHNVSLLIATHSTSLVGALAELGDVRVAFMVFRTREITFIDCNEMLKSLIPVFGAHPLSDLFNHSPLLLVEGDDDERIWSQAVRSSQGRVQLVPRATDSKSKLTETEQLAAKILNSLYERPRAFSIRDGDGETEELQHQPPILRFRLRCYASENLFLTDDVLQLAGTNWPRVQKLLENWMGSNQDHQAASDVNAFKANSWDRCGANLKNCRYVVYTALECSKPWEVLIGQAISAMTVQSPSGPTSLRHFLGEKLVKTVILAET